jgi:hypothetical protein
MVTDSCSWLLSTILTPGSFWCSNRPNWILCAGSSNRKESRANGAGKEADI